MSDELPPLAECETCRAALEALEADPDAPYPDDAELPLELLASWHADGHPELTEG